MKFMLCPNMTRPEAVAFSKTLADWLEEQGHVCTWLGDSCEGVDLIIVIGGDGTVLRVVRHTYKERIPYWIINYGTLGYLCQCQPEEVYEQMPRIIAKRGYIEKRAMMAGRLIREDGEKEFVAVNEAVIYRGSYMRTLRLTLMIGGNEITTFAGDGLLISTPTGSTAYNLSAGGPILMPESRQLVITPICPHSAICAPIVVSSKDEICVRVAVPQAEQDDEGVPQLVIDGTKRFSLHEGDVVECAISSEAIEFVKTNSDSFYVRLQQRLAGKK